MGGNAKLRVLLASDFYPPFIGGAERQTQLLGRELARLGHQVHVATVGQNNLQEKEDDQNVAIHRLEGLSTQVPWFSKDPRRRFHPPFPEPGIVSGIRRLIKETQPEVVHASGWISYSCAAALFDDQIPLVISTRDYGYSCPTRSLLHRGQICQGPAPLKCLNCSRISYGFPKAMAATMGVLGNRRRLVKKVSAIHSVSDFVQQVMKRDLPDLTGRSPHPKRVVMADIISLDDPIQAKSFHTGQYPRLPGESFILFVGALQVNKGIGVLLAAYQLLASPPPLVLMGSVWPDTPKEFPNGVNVIYNAPHDLVMSAWEKCLFGVIPSVWPDPLPGVVREAMGKGKAVIGTRVGGIVDMITENKTGLLVPPGDVNALAQAMKILIGDMELRERLGRAGQADVERFKPFYIAQQFEELYRDLIGGIRADRK